MKSFSTLAAFSISALSVIPSVLAHGRLKSVTIDGKTFEGPQINNSGSLDSVIRTITDVSPVLDINSDNMSCGQGAAKVTAPLSATAKPGSQIDFDWASGEPSVPWPHNVIRNRSGPMMTYIAQCNGDCADFNSLDAKWVKIDEAGREGNQPEGDWIQATTIHVSKPYSMKLPDNLAAGNYLMRHEVIALHNAQSEGLAEFYPSCVQLTISGGSAKANFPSDTVDFPGAYSATDPGILINVYNPTTEAYPFPGPSLAFTSDSGSSNDNTTDSNGDNNSGGTSASPSATKTTTLTSATAAKTTSVSPAPTDAGSNDQQGDCNDDASGSDNNNDSGSNNNDGSNPDNTSDSGDAVVTITRTVFVNPTSQSSKSPRTATAIVTVTADAQAAAATTTLASDTGDYRPKRRSRVMRRVHF
ncbi:hypothetical protein FS837_003607 [Tulasnella sp. UAMH 9824]|nr:hypothetical protein FS837_003607 [Tulasnella sp. UAMH 9824]